MEVALNGRLIIWQVDESLGGGSWRQRKIALSSTTRASVAKISLARVFVWARAKNKRPGLRNCMYGLPDVSSVAQHQKRSRFNLCCYHLSSASVRAIVICERL